MQAFALQIKTVNDIFHLSMMMYSQTHAAVKHELQIIEVLFVNNVLAEMKVAREFGVSADIIGGDE